MISFIRIDDRMIHGQTVTRWSLEYPCDGLIAVNDAAASDPILKQAYKSASDKKTSSGPSITSRTFNRGSSTPRTATF